MAAAVRIPAISAIANASNGNTIGSSCTFYDVTEGDNDIPCQAGTPDCYNAAGDQYGVLPTSTPGNADGVQSNMVQDQHED